MAVHVFSRTLVEHVKRHVAIRNSVGAGKLQFETGAIVCNEGSKSNFMSWTNFCQPDLILEGSILSLIDQRFSNNTSFKGLVLWWNTGADEEDSNFGQNCDSGWK